MITRRRVVQLAVTTAAIPALGPIAMAQTYPSKPVRFIVGFTAGSATDITARLFAQKFQEAWNVPVTVENIPGAGGSVGGDRVAKAAPDGATFYWGANGALSINPTLLPNQTYDVERDLAPVARLLVMPSIVAVNNDVPAKTFGEFVALAKAQPGKLSYASPGTGTPQHIAGEMLKRLAGIDIVHVPYRGAVFTDVIGGRVTMTVQNMGAILPVVREGQLRGLAVTSLTRTPIMPNLPTVAESGLPGFEAVLHYGIIAPAGTPRPIVDRLNSALREALASPEVSNRLALEAAEPMPTTPEEYAADIDREETLWSAIVKKSGAKAE